MQNANRRCTGHATMSTERGNYRLITVHAPFPTIAPNQKSLSNCCMEALSHWPEMKISGRCSPWNFTKNYCTCKCHTQTFLRIPKQYFVFVSSPKKNKPTQSATIVLILWIYRTEDELQSCILVWRHSKGACTVISRSFARSENIVAWPVQRWFAFCTWWKVSEVIQRSRRNNKNLASH